MSVRREEPGVSVRAAAADACPAREAIIVLGVLGWLTLASAAWAQPAPYIGYVYPAGGQQGTTFQVQLGGQRLDGVHAALVTGTGASAQVVEYRRQLGNQEVALLREQLRALTGGPRRKLDRAELDAATRQLVERLEQRIAGFVPRPASAALSSVVVLEVALDADAAPGAREIRLVTTRGVTNPLRFHVGQLPEVARKPMATCPLPVLGKESLAQRHRPPEEELAQIAIPCTMNGQIAPGEVNRYQFAARQGQRLVISVAARQLIPYLADAVPGWFQPMVVLHDADGREIAFNDDYQFQPDPVTCCAIPRDGQYVLTIADALYRGREDFVYRLTVGELPFVTGLFPLGGRAGQVPDIAMLGWNLERTELLPVAADTAPGTYRIGGRTADGFQSNVLPFVLDTLPECMEREPNDNLSQAQVVTQPVWINGRLDRPDDRDLFQIVGQAGDALVAEVYARRLDSPLDSVLKLTDAEGQVLALNDDHEDPGAGLHTHHADAYLRWMLPAAGSYFVHVSDAACCGGELYAYRLRVSAPRPDFELRVVPSAINLRSRGSAPLRVYAIRKDGFAGDIRLSLQDPPDGFSARPVVLPHAQDMVRFPVRTSLARTERPAPLCIAGRAVIDGQPVVRVAVPAEDRMQAFLWRHLVPVADLQAVVFDPTDQPPPTRIPPPVTDAQVAAAAAERAGEPPRFTGRQVAGRLRQLQTLYEEWLLTDDFYNRKVAECQAGR